MAEITVTRNDEASRYEIHQDGTLAGFAAFDHRPEVIRFIHTEVSEEFAGQGLASQLVSAALTDVAERGEVVVPLCPYVAAYLKKHPDTPVEVRWPSPPTS